MALNGSYATFRPYWNKIKEWNKQNKQTIWGGIGGVIITLIVTVILTIYTNSGKQDTYSTNNNDTINISGNGNPTFKDFKSTGEFNTQTDKGIITVNKTVIQGIPHEERPKALPKILASQRNLGLRYK